MSTFWLRVGLCGLALVVGCVARPAGTQARKLSPPRIVEAACGQCQLGLPGRGCELAVRLEGKSYFVDGVPLDQLGDAHAPDGLCNAVRQARVTGQIVNGRFVAVTCELLPK